MALSCPNWELLCKSPSLSLLSSFPSIVVGVITKVSSHHPDIIMEHFRLLRNLITSSSSSFQSLHEWYHTVCGRVCVCVALTRMLCCHTTLLMSNFVCNLFYVIRWVLLVLPISKWLQGHPEEHEWPPLRSHSPSPQQLSPTYRSQLRMGLWEFFSHYCTTPGCLILWIWSYR